MRSLPARDDVYGDFCDERLRVRNQYIDSTSGRKFVTGNGFSDHDFL